MRSIITGILVSLCVFVGKAAGQADKAHNWEADVSRRVSLLASDSEEDHTAASDWIMNSEPAALPAIEAAAKSLASDSAAGKRLIPLLEKLKPLAKLRAIQAARVQEDYEWNKRTALEAYEKWGSKNPAWDEEARKAIKQFVSMDRQESAASFATLVHLDKDLNCDDPLIAYFNARMQGFQPKPDRLEQINAYLFACKGFEKSAYPAERKCYAYARFIQFLSEVDSEKKRREIRALGQKFANQALELWPTAVSEPGVPRSINRLADLVIQAQVHYGADRGKIIEQMLPPFEKAFPNDAVAMAFAGNQYVHYAWDARGSGTSDTVTPEGWKLMADRLSVAERLLGEAYKRDPSDATAATHMISCELGQGKGKDQMERWFQRAIKADPAHSYEYSDSDAYNNKLYYLQPKWFGSLEECLTFGRECAATRNYRDNVTWVLIDVHQEFAKMTGNPAAYWRHREVWADLESVLLPPVKADPENHGARTRYAYWACQCERWKIADEQFKLLGDNVVPQVWPSKAASDAARVEAAQKGG
jgi:hypothetical protein